MWGPPPVGRVGFPSRSRCHSTNDAAASWSWCAVACCKNENENEMCGYRLCVIVCGSCLIQRLWVVSFVRRKYGAMCMDNTQHCNLQHRTQVKVRPPSHFTQLPRPVETITREDSSGRETGGGGVEIIKFCSISSRVPINSRITVPILQTSDHYKMTQTRGSTQEAACCGQHTCISTRC